MYKISIVFTDGDVAYYDGNEGTTIHISSYYGKTFPTYNSALAFAKYLRKNFNQVVYTEIVEE